MRRGMYLAAALCLLLCGCGKKDAAEAQAVQQRYAALTGAVAEAEIVSHPEGETRSFTVRCTCDRTKDTATTTVMAPEELAGLSATVTGEKLLIQYDGPALAAGVGDTVSPANCSPICCGRWRRGMCWRWGRRRWRISPACGWRWTPQTPTARRWCVPCGWQRRIRCMQSFHGKGSCCCRCASRRFSRPKATVENKGKP